MKIQHWAIIFIILVLPLSIMCRSMITKKNLTLRDETRYNNIIDNAKRYAKTKIKIVLRKDRLRIYNDGEHIDEKFLDNIFKPYEKGSKGEFGLGMSIVKKTVDFFGLDLKVVNEPVGVSFIITYKK